MTETLLDVAAPPATGAFFFNWFPNEIASPARIYLGAGLWLGSPTELVGEMQATTDPGAQRRAFGLQTSELAKNLLGLAAVAKLLIPELREMTIAERKNLRRHYSKVYRKA